MSQFVELSVLIATLVGMLQGGLCIYWVKVHPSARHARWGRRLFIATLLSLGGMALVAAVARADGLAPLGLLSGLLIVGMLWESPMPNIADEQPLSAYIPELIQRTLSRERLSGRFCSCGIGLPRYNSHTQLAAGIRDYRKEATP